MAESERAEEAEARRQFQQAARRGDLLPPMTITEIVSLLRSEKAADVCVLSLKGRSDIAAYMLFASGVSPRHLHAMATELVTELRRHKTDELPVVEGRPTDDWMIVDAGRVIVQLMTPDARARYALERKWSLAIPSEMALLTGGGSSGEGDIEAVQMEVEERRATRAEAGGAYASGSDSDSDGNESDDSAGEGGAKRSGRGKKGGAAVLRPKGKTANAARRRL